MNERDNDRILAEYSELCRHFFEKENKPPNDGWFVHKLEDELLDFIYVDSASGFLIKVRPYFKENKTAIVFCGNNLEEEDISDNIQEYLEFIPEALEELLSAGGAKLQALLQLKDNNSEVVLIGFSLGAAVAEIAACRFQKRAVTFESPGTSDVLKQFSQKQPKFYGGYEQIEMTTFLTVPNKINTYCNKKTNQGGHLGNVYRIYIPHVEQTSWWYWGKALFGSADRVLSVVLWGGAFVSIWRKFSTAVVAKEAAGVAINAGFERDLASVSLQLAENALKIHDMTLFKTAEHLEKREILYRAIMQAYDRLSVAGEALSKAEKYSEDMQKLAQLAMRTLVWYGSGVGGDFVGRASFQFFLPMLGKNKAILIDKGQHSIKKIRDALDKLAKREVKGGKQEGAIMCVETWPTTLSPSWGTFFINVGCSYLPWRKYNAGIHNMFDVNGKCAENEYIEANVEIMDGYKLKK